MRALPQSGNVLTVLCEAVTLTTVFRKAVTLSTGHWETVTFSTSFRKVVAFFTVFRKAVTLTAVFREAVILTNPDLLITDEKQAVVVLQLAESSRIVRIEVGNEHSAFVEVLAGRSTSPIDDDNSYQVTVIF